MQGEHLVRRPCSKTTIRPFAKFWPWTMENFGFPEPDVFFGMPRRAQPGIPWVLYDIQNHHKRSNKRSNTPEVHIPKKYFSNAIADSCRPIPHKTPKDYTPGDLDLLPKYNLSKPCNTAQPAFCLQTALSFPRVTKSRLCRVTRLT